MWCGKGREEEEERKKDRENEKDLFSGEGVLAMFYTDMIIERMPY